jgi:hypothetical protein
VALDGASDRAQSPAESGSLLIMPSPTQPKLSRHVETVAFCNSLKRPVLILSSRAGRGNISIADAIYEHFDSPVDVQHRSIEDFLPPGIVHEDLIRYKLISNFFPLALTAIYTLPIFYYRKLLREQIQTTRLDALSGFIEGHRIATVVCISHRQAFWTTVLKRNASLDVAIYGVLNEFGPSLGWRYIFWDKMDGFVSPLPASALQTIVPAGVPFKCLPLPARASFRALSVNKAPRESCLVVGGFWGQGRMMQALRLITLSFGELHLHVVCGDNKRLERKVRRRYGHRPGVSVYGLVDSIEPLLAQCGCVVTKPGMATILEAHAAGRKIFLFGGLPVAEAHNARYAIEHFNAEWLSVAAFHRWLRDARE